MRDRLLVLVVDLWEFANNKPLLFAPFALPPPTRPNPAIVHNWALASMRFGESLGKSEVVEAALMHAGTNPELEMRSPSLERRVRLPVTIENEKLDLNEVWTDDRDAFYTSLGRRLVQLQEIDKRA